MCFRGEIKKLLILLVEKMCLIWSYGLNRVCSGCLYKMVAAAT